MVNCVHSAVNISFQLSTQTSLVNMNAVPNCSVPDRLRFTSVSEFEILFNSNNVNLYFQVCRVFICIEASNWSSLFYFKILKSLCCGSFSRELFVMFSDVP